MLLVHGGGWEAGDRVTYITPMFRPLASAGLAWFSMDYRLTPEGTHAEQLQDLRDAIAFLREQAGSFNIDPRKLVIVGESASGQMVAQIGTEDPALAGVVSFYGVYDFRADGSQPDAALCGDTAVRHHAARRPGARDAAEVLADCTPHTRTSRRCCSIHGTAEGLWAQGQAMAARLQAIGARHQLLALDGAPHGMENWEGHAAVGALQGARRGVDRRG